MTPEPEHQGERGLGDQIARYRTAFISIVAMVVFALFVGGYILSNERLSLPGWVPVIGQGIRHAQGRLPHRAGGRAGAGPVGHDRRGQDRRNRKRSGQRRRRARDDEHHAQVRALHLSQRHHAAAPQDAAEGHDRRGRSGHPQRRSRSQRLHDSPVADRPRRELRGIPRRARRRNARLPAGADQRCGRRLEGQLGESLGCLQALRPDLALYAQDHRSS